MALAIYTPDDLRGGTLDGAPLALQAEQEFVGNVYSAPARGPARLDPDRRACRFTARPAGGAYRLTLGHQPLANDDSVTVRAGAGDTRSGRRARRRRQPRDVGRRRRRTCYPFHCNVADRAG